MKHDGRRQVFPLVKCETFQAFSERQMRSKTEIVEHSLLIASVPRDEEHQISGRLARLDRMGLRRHSNGNKSICMPDPKSAPLMTEG